MIIKKDHPAFEEFLDSIISDMLENGIKISDVEGLKAEVIAFEIDDKEDEVSLTFRNPEIIATGEAKEIVLLTKEENQ